MKGEGVPDPLEARARALESELAHRETLLAAAFASSYDGLAILVGGGRLPGDQRRLGAPDRHRAQRVDRAAPGRDAAQARHPAPLREPQVMAGILARDHARERARRRVGADHRQPAPGAERRGAAHRAEPAQHHAPEPPQVPARARARRLEAGLGRAAPRRVPRLAPARGGARRRDLRQRAVLGRAAHRRRDRRVRLDRAARRRDRDRQGRGRAPACTSSRAAPTSRSSR